ncbi:MAG: cbb3-type cytochrome c oxidase subunit II [Vampirovibrionales bacterium]|nr:cbb3-type cytochrome c oxidase subunit II [Vampirovibrionales bacterium]
MDQQRFNYVIAGSFVALIFLTIIFVTAILPATTFQPEPSLAAVKYTPAEQHGRDVYRREGCFYCHSQFNRYQDREGGEMVSAGDYVYETPHVLGTERTGPDLSNVGGKYSSEWHWAHHVNPRKVKPGSIMPSYSYLSRQDMDDLIAYLQTLGREREILARQGLRNPKAEPGSPEEWEKKPITWLSPPQELRDEWERIAKSKDVNNSAFANAGRGIFMQNCAQCHGVSGRGNGPVSASMIKKPANFTRPFYSGYSDDMWYYRVKEGVAGTRMPRWGKTLSEEQMAYLVAFLKTLPAAPSTAAGTVEVTNYSQLDDPFGKDKTYHTKITENYEEIESLNKAAHHDPYVYGGGRSE